MKILECSAQRRVNCGNDSILWLFVMITLALIGEIYFSLHWPIEEKKKDIVCPHFIGQIIMLNGNQKGKIPPGLPNESSLIWRINETTNKSHAAPERMVMRPKPAASRGHCHQGTEER